MNFENDRLPSTVFTRGKDLAKDGHCRLAMDVLSLTSFPSCSLNYTAAPAPMEVADSVLINFVVQFRTAVVILLQLYMPHLIFSSHDRL